MRTLTDVDVAGKRVLVRVDFNVPLDQHGQISDDTRIRAALTTIEELRERRAQIIVVGHLGRPRDREPELTMRPVAQRLGELLQTPVQLAPAVVGADVEALADRLKPGQLLMLENVRYERGETENDDKLARALAGLADIYVNDAFGAAHRAHASTEGIVGHVSVAVAGRLLEREVRILESVIKNPSRPLLAVLGGAKVSDKIGVIAAFLSRADHILIGGAMCFPFFAASGNSVGASLCEEEGIAPARAALRHAHADKLELPTDLVAGDKFAADANRKELPGRDVPIGWMGLDIGPVTAQAYSNKIAAAGTVFWNGPMGAFEMPEFAAGTAAVANAIAETTATTVVGGGDSVAALKQFGLADRIDHISTGGGAALELLEGRSLPGVEALQ